MSNKTPDASPSQFPSNPPSRKLRVRDSTAKKASTLKDYRLDELDLPIPYYRLRVGPIKSSAKVDGDITSPSTGEGRREKNNEQETIAKLKALCKQPVEIDIEKMPHYKGKTNEVKGKTQGKQKK